MLKRALLVSIIVALASSASAYTVGGTAFDKRIKLTISQTYVDAALSSFPLWVRMYRKADPADDMQADGDDMIFTSSDGSTVIPHELVFFENWGSSVTAEVHVCVPTVASAADTDIYMYYGNAVCGDQSQADRVWTNGYEAVYHLQDAASTASDSTAAGDDMTAINSPATTPSVDVCLGNAINYDDGDSDYHTTGAQQAAANEITISAYAKLEDWNYATGMCVVGNSSNLCNLKFFQNGGDKIEFRCVNNVWGNGTPSTSTAVAEWRWYYCVGTWEHDDDLVNLYVDDMLATATLANDAFPSAFYMAIGGRNDGSEFWDGDIDEVRHSNVARDADWNHAEWSMFDDNASFLTWGAEEGGAAASPEFQMWWWGL